MVPLLLHVAYNDKEIVIIILNNLFKGWDVRKALKMLRDSNCGILEWLHSPIVYYSDHTLVNGPETITIFLGTYQHFVEMRELAKRHTSWKSVAYHYLHQSKKHLDGSDLALTRLYNF